VGDALPQILRSDARDNRDRILSAARAVFAAEGFDAPMRSVARRAGVGPATLYRHFATKQELITEAFADQFDACHAIIAAGLADLDPWHGLSSVITNLFELHARDWGFAAAFAAAFPRSAALPSARARSVASLAELVARARPDLTVDDLILLLRANAGLRGGSEPARVAASRRLAELTLRALRAGPTIQ
jgi:AcrR family transcriptional regulator